MFVKHCKVEVYLTELKLCEDSNMDNVITRRFSKADTIGRPESLCSNGLFALLVCKRSIKDFQVGLGSIRFHNLDFLCFSFTFLFSLRQLF